MFRQAITFMALCIVGLTRADDFQVEINGNLSIATIINTNNEIPHQQINFEPLKLMTDVEGIIHYSIGARSSSKCGIFLAKIHSQKKGNGNIYDQFFHSFD